MGKPIVLASFASQALNVSMLRDEIESIPTNAVELALVDAFDSQRPKCLPFEDGWLIERDWPSPRAALAPVALRDVRYEPASLKGTQKL